MTLLEIILSIDNLVSLTIAASKLPREQRPFAQRFGFMGALVRGRNKVQVAEKTDEREE